MKSKGERNRSGQGELSDGGAGLTLVKVAGEEKKIGQEELQTTVQF